MHFLFEAGNYCVRFSSFGMKYTQILNVSTTIAYSTTIECWNINFIECFAVAIVGSDIICLANGVMKAVIVMLTWDDEKMNLVMTARGIRKNHFYDNQNKTFNGKNYRFKPQKTSYSITWNRSNTKTKIFQFLFGAWYPEIVWPTFNFLKVTLEAAKST